MNNLPASFILSIIIGNLSHIAVTSSYSRFWSTLLYFYETDAVNSNNSACIKSCNKTRKPECGIWICCSIIRSHRSLQWGVLFVIPAGFGANVRRLLHAVRFAFRWTCQLLQTPSSIPQGCRKKWRKPVLKWRLKFVLKGIATGKKKTSFNMLCKL